VSTRMDSTLARDLARFGATDVDVCMQCGACSATCPLSSGPNPFPRKIVRYLQLGLEDRLLGSPEPWMCYFCGDCTKECPRGVDPGEIMMATRRYLTAAYDWTGLARRFYLSKAWELSAIAVVALFVVGLFAFFHGPVITDHMAVNTFAPVAWVEIGDLTMAVLLSAFLLTNAYRMFRHVMRGTRAPLSLYVAEAQTFVLNFATQKRWRECGEDRGRWLKHFLLVTGYVTMMTLIIVLIRWFQVDDTSWHVSSLFGYYATAMILFVTGEMLLARRRRQEPLHRHSEFSDWLFLGLLFLTGLTGIVMHALRLAGLPLATYIAYVVHLAVAVPMLVVEVPFGKWSHMLYRPLALYLSRVKERASSTDTMALADLIKAKGDATFLTCLQCGSCTGACPWSLTSRVTPRQILRKAHLDLTGAEEGIWNCVACNACALECPRGIEVPDVIRAIRSVLVQSGKTPDHLVRPLQSLEAEGNPWGGKRADRTAWRRDLAVPDFTREHETCFYTCCTTAYDPRAGEAGRTLLRLLQSADVSLGALGTEESCCGEQAHLCGADCGALRERNARLLKERGVQRLLLASPHCLSAFRNAYRPLLGSTVVAEHATQTLARLIAEGRLLPTREVPRTVTYHDPCTLGREAGIFDAPREILESIPGLTLVEMDHCRGESLCCGGGGGGAFAGRTGEQSFGVLRVREALATGAEVIATACPFCVLMLEDAVRELGLQERLEVRDVAELLAQSVGADEHVRAGRASALAV
jgi:quinone-modifying oxidoreductase subunit QmoC